MDRADRLRAALRAAIQEKPTADVHQTYLSITSAPEFFAAAELCNDDSAFATAAAKLLADYVIVMSNF